MVYFLGLGEGMAWANIFAIHKSQAALLRAARIDERSIIRSLGRLVAKSIPTPASSKWGMPFCCLCKTRIRARRISDRRSGHNSPPPPGYRTSSRTSWAATSSFCPLASTRSASSGSARCSFKASGAGADIHISISSWFGQNDGHGLRVNPPQRSVLGSVIRKPKRSFVVSPSLTFRTDVHRVQRPAKKASGRLSSNAHHNGGREPSGKTSFSAKLVKGTMQRLSTPSHRRQ
jgi:hypothetical protein